DDEPESFPPLFLWGRTLLPVSLVLLPGLAGLFLCGASGHTRRCRRQPTGETPGRRGCRAWLPTNISERPLALRRPWRKTLAAVRVLAVRCLGGSRRESPTPKWTGNGTQITYADTFSCGPMFLKYENKSDRLRAGFDRQAGGARRFAGSAGGEDPGDGHRPRCRAARRDR